MSRLIRGSALPPACFRRSGARTETWLSAAIPEDGTRRKLGSRISDAAGRGGGNFLTPEIAHIARRETAYREIGAMIDEARLVEASVSFGVARIYSTIPRAWPP
jgi:hypothetical protein